MRYWLFIGLAALLYGEPVAIRQGETLHLAAPANAVGARMNGRTIRLFPEGAGRSGLMPVPVLEPPGTYTLELLDANQAVLESRSVTVRDAHYPSQNITISQTLSELKPSPGETETVAAFRNSVSDVRFWKEPLLAPVAGCLTSRFGVRRLHNGKPTGDYHGGIDQRARAGEPIRAAAAGKVAIARQFALHGGTVAIDHGQGLESIYLHMSKIQAMEGAEVQQGEIIGYAGSTGRSTAPHLHWSIYVNGIPVSPMQWIAVNSCAPPKPKQPKR